LAAIAIRLMACLSDTKVAGWASTPVCQAAAASNGPPAAGRGVGLLMMRRHNLTARQPRADRDAVKDLLLDQAFAAVRQPSW
jgi:hypothetical protein